MAVFEIQDLTFTYPDREVPALDHIDLKVEPGEMISLCGRSGCGKTTLLKNLKTVLAPYGEKTGSIKFFGRELSQVDEREQASRIGYVFQNPDNQIVTDMVWHELAFGPENLGWDTDTIRMRVAEMAAFFGIQNWFGKRTDELSGGEKQILNLASVMVMQPDILILDEPTAQLDPIAAGEFFDTAKKVNSEIGTTVIISEHRLESLLPLSHRTVVMDRGKKIIDDSPANAAALLAKENHHMFTAMPTPLQAYSLLYEKGIGCQLQCPVDVGSGRRWLTELAKTQWGEEIKCDSVPIPEQIGDTEGDKSAEKEPIIDIKDLWFRYGRSEPDVIKGLSMKIYPREIFTILGGNGAGKSTTLSLMAGLQRPYRGKVKIKGKKPEDHGEKLFRGLLGVLPQDPQSVFVSDTVRGELEEMLDDKDLSREAKEEELMRIAKVVEIDSILDFHPYDISGGEQQRVALAKVLLMDPEIILLDEPTKGMDNFFKEELARILRGLTDRGKTLVLVSHDIEFCAKYGSRCAMFFDGSVTTVNTPRKFFSGNRFYTTAANKMSAHIFKDAITTGDIYDLVMENIQE